MRIYTIGFCGKSAEDFFELLRGSGIRRVLDVRLKNVSQMAGFAKRQDLPYFLKTILGADCVHDPGLAPPRYLLDDWGACPSKDQVAFWPEYEKRFLRAMVERRSLERQNQEDFVKPTVLLCCEVKPDMCHRRLVAEGLQQRWGDVEIIHL